MPSTLPERISIDTRDPDEAHGYLQTTYVEHSVRLTGSKDQFRFRHHITDGGNFFVARYEHSMTQIVGVSGGPARPSFASSSPAEPLPAEVNVSGVLRRENPAQVHLGERATGR